MTSFSNFKLNEDPLVDEEMEDYDEEMEELEDELEDIQEGEFEENFNLNEPAEGAIVEHSFDLNEPAEAQEEPHHYSRLTTDKKFDMLNFLLNKASNGHLQYGTINAGSVESLGMGDRSCIRDVASKIGINKTTVHRMIKQGVLKPHSNSLHPGLTEAHKKTRLEWVLKLLQGSTLEEKSKYFPMYDFVHLDEKWFYQTKKTQRCYLEANEKGKYRSASSSKFIPKVMFTACVARPRFDADGKCIFDGKIGIFPFTYQEPAKRKSKNREKGAIVTKLIESVNKVVTRRMLIDQIIPAIKSKWPQDGEQRVIYIQQDNARPHITQEDAEWQQVYMQDGFTFVLLQQPPNSPDLNILDLGFFRSIQSLMHKKMPKDIDAMLSAVHNAFYELDPTTLADVWMTLEFVMNEILKCKGCNSYDMPHNSKRKLQALGLLPGEIRAPMWAIIEAWKIVNGEESIRVA